MQEGINEDHHEEEKVHRWEGSQNAGAGACHKGGGKGLQ